MSITRRFIVLCLLAVACGPGKSGDTGDTGGTGSSEGTASDTGTVTAADTGTPTTGAVGSCDMFMSDAEIGPPVRISLRHAGDEPLWIAASGCGGAPAFDIVADGVRFLVHPDSECSPTRCDDFLGQPDCSLGCNDCGVPFAVRLDPGAIVDVNWTGVDPIPMTMTAECAPGTQCQRECLRWTRAAAGDYSVQVAAFRGCTGACACDFPSPGGSCPIYEPLETSDPVVFVVPLTYPETTTVEVVLDP